MSFLNIDILYIYVCFDFYTDKPSNSSISNICDMSVNKPPSDHSNSINKNGNKYILYIIIKLFIC